VKPVGVARPVSDAASARLIRAPIGVRADLKVRGYEGVVGRTLKVRGYEGVVGRTLKVRGYEALSGGP
jgi:hypothetical protein